MTLDWTEICRNSSIHFLTMMLAGLVLRYHAPQKDQLFWQPHMALGIVVCQKSAGDNGSTLVLEPMVRVI